MSVGLPKRIDAKRLAASDGLLEGKTTCQPAGRLAGLIIACEGDIDVSLQFGRGSMGELQVSGQIRGVVSMDCQRCLEPVSIALDCQVALVLVESEEAASRLPDSVDSLVSPDGTVDLLELVEDELILALPIVPRHDSCKAAYEPGELTDSAATEESVNEKNPFAVLKDLK